MEKLIMICDNCEKDFYEEDVTVNPETKERYRRDSKVMLRGGMVSLDFCAPCEKTVTVARAREMSQERIQKSFAKEKS